MFDGGEILFLAHRLPFPPDRGDRIRSHHILKALADIAPVHLGCFVDSDEDLQHLDEADKVVASHCVMLRDKSLPLAGVESLLRREAVSLSAFRNAELGRWVQNLLESGRIGAIYVFSGQMGQFVPASWAGQLLVDLVDVDSAKFEAYGKDAHWPRSLIFQREGKLLSRVEERLAARADHTFLVSEQEAALLQSRTSGARHVKALGNGIDADVFDPDIVSPTPLMSGQGPHFVFTGQMDYPPNVAAVDRMAKHILPHLRAVHPKAKFHVVGRAPTADVRALSQLPGCHVWGEVPDMRPYLAAADVVVAPLMIGRGVQNKVLEAMAMARPVVLSPEAAIGIPGVDGEHYFVAKDNAHLLQLALQLVAEPGLARSIGRNARQFVCEKRSWPAMLADLPRLMNVAPEGKGQCDAA